MATPTLSGWLTLGWCVLVAPASAQESVARELADRRANLEQHSPDWFVLGLEQVDAELEWNLERAAATVADLTRAANEKHDRDQLAAATALDELVRAMRDGPASVRRFESEPAQPRAEAHSAIRVHTSLARARFAWLEDRPAEALGHALAGLEAARSAEKPGSLRLVAAWTTHELIQGAAPTLDDDLLREFERLADEPARARFEPRLALDAYWLEHGERASERRHETLDRIARTCDALGDWRSTCHVELARAVLFQDEGRLEETFEHLEAARAIAETAGFRREIGIALEHSALVALEHGDLVRSAAFLELCAPAIEGRGFPDRDVGLAHMRLRLAVARDDRDAVLEQTKLLNELRAVESTRHRRSAAVRERLLGSELQRIAFARQLEDEHSTAAASVDRMRRALISVVVFALAVIVVQVLRGRRRLIATNRRLRDEIERAEAETTARRALEERMRLLERSESLGLVAGGVAHDFNNLLVGVIGNAELLRLDESDPTRRERLDVITAAGERAARLCSQLQLYAGNEPVVFEAVDVAPLLTNFAPVLSAAAGSSVRVDVAGVLHDSVVDGNRTQLEQAILNLVSNARDAHAHRIQLRVFEATPDAADLARGSYRGEVEPGACCCIEVEDDGEGMNRALLERIFDPFFTTRFPGRGLGLAVVFGVVRRHRGLISVTSEPGRGTCFRMYFPARRAPSNDVLPAAPTRPAAAHRTIAPMTVLTVDDESDVREYVRGALSVRGHRVVLASDLESATQLLRTISNDARTVALIDLTLPTCDGRDVARALRRERGDLHIVLMSGHGSQHLQETARELDVDGSISKPFASTELEHVLDEALSSARMTATSGEPSVTSAASVSSV